MSLSMTLRDIGDSIRSQPTRFALSFLAIGIGVISLVLLLAVLSALNTKSERLVQDLGVDVVGIEDVSGHYDERASLVLRDLGDAPDGVKTVLCKACPGLIRQEVRLHAEMPV